MKKLLLLLLTLFCIEAQMELNAQTRQGNKILVAFFSWSGNTRAVAEDIHRKVGGDIFEIVTVNPYPKEFNACVEQAEREKESNYRPALANRVNNMDTYDVIFLGYPSWFYTIPMAVATFLESYNLRGKIIVPFSTHGGGGLSGSIRDITRLCPGSTILEAIAIRDSRANNSGADVDRWLRKLAFIR